MGHSSESPDALLFRGGGAVSARPDARNGAPARGLRRRGCSAYPLLTSNAGWRFESTDLSWLAAVVERLKSAGCRVSLFVDPDAGQVAGAKRVGADRVELYTEYYARTFASPQRRAVFGGYKAAAEKAVALGLGVNAGHDLDLENLPFLAANLPGLQEVSIGHALVSDALWMGLDAAVRAYLRALAPA